MCKYSLEHVNTRKAEQGETLVANSHYSAKYGYGVFVQPGTSSHGTLTCVLDGQMLTAEAFMIDTNVGYKMPSYVHGLWADPQQIDRGKYSGTRQVVTLVDARQLPNIDKDCLLLDDGILIALKDVVPGTEFYVGIKQTLDDKLGIDEKSLAVAALDIDPNKKPDGDEEKEPAPQEPAQEPPEPVPA